MFSSRERRNMNIRKSAAQLLAIIIMLTLIVTDTCHTTPLNNVFDSQPIYNVYGMDKFYVERCKFELSFCLSPIYAQTNTVRNGKNYKVPIGNRLGSWNLLGLYFGEAAAPQAPAPVGPFAQLYASQQSVAAITSQTRADDPYYRIGPEDLTATPPIFAGGLTNEQNFASYSIPFATGVPWAYVTVPANYEKIGLRSQVNFDFPFGLGVSIKSGVVDAKQKVKRFVLDPVFQADIMAAPRPTQTPQPPPATDAEQTDARDLYESLFEPAILKKIAANLNLDISTYHKASMEDTHIQAYWHIPFDICDEKEEDVIVTIAPYFNIGLWIPTGQNFNQNKVFSIPTGNDGWYGITAECSIALDFPLVPKKDQHIQGNVGGGVLGFVEHKTISNYRIPSSALQSGLMIPWSTTVRKTPGLTWYFNASAKAENFIGNLSAYFDFVYTQHLKDQISLRETNPVRLAAFQNGIQTAINNSWWKNQQVNGFLNYQIVPLLGIGGGFQAHISGTRVYRTLTLLGSIAFTF